MGPRHCSVGHRCLSCVFFLNWMSALSDEKELAIHTGKWRSGSLSLDVCVYMYVYVFK